MPKNDDTLDYFKRYSKFYLQNTHDDICWRVEAIDWISTPGILEVTAVEYYANETEDDIENGIVGGLIIEQENPNSENVEEVILGETFIKPKKEYEFKCASRVKSTWSVDKKYPVILTVKDDKTVAVKWNSSYSGQFELHYGDYVKTIIVESLF
jgi:hypothetical protein